MNTFYFFILFIPIGVAISIVSKKEKVVVDAFMLSVILSLVFIICLKLGFSSVKINTCDTFLFNVVGGVVGSYLYVLIKYIIKKIKNKK